MKKLVILGLTFTTLASLVACSGGDKESKSDPEAKVEQIKADKKIPDDATADQKAAIKKAESYLQTLHFSKEGLKKQLTSEFDKFSPEDADYAIEFLQPDWNEQAVKAAKSYLETGHFSEIGLKNQLTSEFDQFTEEEAAYGIANANPDWNQQAVKAAKSYRETLSMSTEAIKSQLTSSFDGFTEEQAQYAIDHIDE